MRLLVDIEACRCIAEPKSAVELNDTVSDNKHPADGNLSSRQAIPDLKDPILEGRFMRRRARERKIRYQWLTPEVHARLCFGMRGGRS